MNGKIKKLGVISTLILILLGFMASYLTLYFWENSMNPTVDILGGTITKKIHRYHNGQIYEFKINNLTIVEVNNVLFNHYNLGETFFYRDGVLPELIKGVSK